MRAPVVASVSDAEVEELTELIDAVWHRVCASDYDTSSFELSEQKAMAVAASGKSAKTRKRELQRAYERWLVDTDQTTYARG